MKKCVFCGKDFSPISNHNRNIKLCSDACRLKYHGLAQTERRRKCNLGRQLGLSGGKIGKISELIVVIDLLKRGYEVYTAFEDTHPFDLLVYKGGKTLKIEVKTGIMLPSGTRTISNKDKEKLKRGVHDVLAVVYNLSEIVYSPLELI